MYLFRHELLLFIERRRLVRQHQSSGVISVHQLVIIIYQRLLEGEASVRPIRA